VDGVIENPNIEIRNAKQYQNPNDQNSKRKNSGFTAFGLGPLNISVIRICFEFRYSNFGFIHHCPTIEHHLGHPK